MEIPAGRGVVSKSAFHGDRGGGGELWMFSGTTQYKRYKLIMTRIIITGKYTKARNFVLYEL